MDDFSSESTEANRQGEMKQHGYAEINIKTIGELRACPPHYQSSEETIGEIFSRLTAFIFSI